MSKFRVSGNKSSILVYPTVKPELSLDFVNNPEGIDPAYSFTRNSSATYVGPDGYIKTAAVNQPRFDYDPLTGECKGLLVEESRTNLLSYSESPSNWSRTNLTISPDKILSPDGNSYVNKLVETEVNGGHFITLASGINIKNYNRTFSFFVNAAERTAIEFQLTSRTSAFNPNVSQRIRFNLQSGDVTSFNSNFNNNVGTPNYGIIKYSSGWYRIYVYVNTSGDWPGSAVSYLRLCILNENNSASYTGISNSGLYIWGRQLESKDFPSSYIKTVNSTTTRNSDKLSLNNYKIDEKTTIVLENSFNYKKNNQTILNVGDTSLYYFKGHIVSNFTNNEIRTGESNSGFTKRLLSLNDYNSKISSSHFTEYSFQDNSKLKENNTDIINFGFKPNNVDSYLNGHIKNFKLYKNIFNLNEINSILNSKDILGNISNSKASGGDYEYYIKKNNFVYKVHEFTTTGLSTIIINENIDIDYLIVAGGGGAQSIGRGAGGAGGVLYGSTHINSGVYEIYVGSGGSASNNGQDSTFNNIIAIGGGAGGSPGKNGGSGGGGNDGNHPGGLGTPGQGYNGGDGFTIGGYYGGGGGGAGGPGQNGGISNGGNGGIGRKIDITGVELYYGGGGAAHGFFSGLPGSAGLGGGGDSGNRGDGGNGEPNTGGGGGAYSGSGGSGIVIIRYKV